MQWGKLIAIDRDTRQRKRFDLARFTIQPPMLDFIHTKVCIKVDEDVFLVTMAEELLDVVDRIGGIEFVGEGYADTSSLPSISISVVPGSISHDITGEHLLGAALPLQATADNSKFNSKKKVMIAATRRDDRDNDEVESDNVEHVELSQDVMGMIDGGGKLTEYTFERGKRVQNMGVSSEGCTNLVLFGPERIRLMGSPCKAHNLEFGFAEDSSGLGNRLVGMENPDDLRWVVDGSKSPSRGMSQPKIASRQGRCVKKKQMNDILQLRLSKRVIGKGKKSKKIEKSRIEKEVIGEVTGQLSFGDSLQDSNIINYNQIILAENENPDCRKVAPSLREICAFLTQLGIMEERYEKEIIQCIAEMEKHDATLFSGELQPKRVDNDEVSNVRL
ncbi:hypothetical protein Ancab_022884 [Ancistrocladus abbreviatus]